MSEMEAKACGSENRRARGGDEIRKAPKGGGAIVGAAIERMLVRWFQTLVLILLTAAAVGGAIYWASVDLPTQCHDTGAEQQDKTGQQGIGAEKESTLGHLIPTQDRDTRNTNPRSRHTHPKIQPLL